MPSAKTHPTLTLTRIKHRKRVEKDWYPKIEDDPELKSAYHSLQLHWIATVPGYREAVRRKLNEVATKAEKRAIRIEHSQRTLDGQRLSQVLKVKEREDQLERLAGY